MSTGAGIPWQGFVRDGTEFRTGTITQLCGTARSQVSRRKIDDLLSERHRRFTPLQKMLRRSANQQSWTAQLQALLPPALSRDCHVTDVRGDTVVVVCRTAASATRLRFIVDDLLADLTQLGDFSDATRIQIRVASG